MDDDSSVRRSLARLLTAAGYRTETFADAAELLGRERDGPACVLLDVRMPDVSGFELLDVLKASRPELVVVFVTGHGDIPMAVRAIKSGATNFLVKPVDETVLLAAVAQAIGAFPAPYSRGAGSGGV